MYILRAPPVLFHTPTQVFSYCKAFPFRVVLSLLRISLNAVWVLYQTVVFSLTTLTCGFPGASAVAEVVVILRHKDSSKEVRASWAL